MRSIIRDSGAAALALGVIALMSGTTALAAEPSQNLPTVTVQARREVTITRAGTSATTKNRGELVTMTRRINFADLDLTAPSAADELHKRINDAAQELCHNLETVYPNGATDVPGFEHTNENCVKDAVAAADKRVNAAVAAAKK